MKKRLFFTLWMMVVFSLCTLPLVGQEYINREARKRERLGEFSQRMSREWQENRLEAEKRAKIDGIPVRMELEDGRIIELQRYWNDRPLYYTTFNREAAETIASDKVWPGGGAGLDLTGSTETLGIWDGGQVRHTHQEFEGRVTQKDSASLSWHATHVAGTMIAAGLVLDGDTRGMSYQADLYSYDWNNDLTEMGIEAADGMRVSNHSYGYLTGWVNNYLGDGRWVWFGVTSISQTEDFEFGYYHTSTRDWDDLVYDAGDYLPVVAAGNERGKGPSSQPVEHWVWGWTGSGWDWILSTTVRDIDGGADGYDTISYFNLSKNVLTVGAVEGIAGGYEEPGDVVMSSFSGWGPTDDGRIKPDVVAKGVSTLSAHSNSDSAYATSSGTSMASPSISGSIGLLHQHYRDEIGATAPLASTMKALVLHTADPTGASVGPDYEYGWGLMNTERAADVISKHALVSNGNGDGHIFEVELVQNDDFSLVVESDGTEPLKVTICWTDPPAEPLHLRSPQPPLLNNPEPMLINDLDLRIIGPDSTEYEPWILDLENPSDPATTGDNYRDNVEQVYIADPETGVYTVEVTHKGTSLEGGSQTFSLVITGASKYVAVQDWYAY